MTSFTVDRKAFLGVLSLVERASDRKATMPILGSVRVTVQADGTIELSATDLFVGLRGTVKASGKVTPGSVAIPARDLLERIKAMPDGNLVVSTGENGQLTIKSEGKARKFVVRAQPGEDFPPLATQPTDGPSTKVPSKTLAKLIDGVFEAVSTDETRAHLASVLVEWDGTALRMVSTDGHRLHKSEAETSSVNSLRMLIPRKGVQELRKVCDSSDEVEISQAGNTAFFTAGFTLDVKLTDAQFPPYDQVIPKQEANMGTIAMKPFVEAVRAVAVAAAKSTGGVVLEFTKGKATVKVNAQSPDSGDASDEFDLDTEWSGSSVRIGFNHVYLLQAATAFGDEAPKVLCTGELDPMKLTTESLTVVCMPMRV